MEISANYLPCDGCGLPASPEHIADRLRRLELSTRFRPVHIGVLFVALAAPARAEDDFYGAANSKEFADPLLDALDIRSSTDRATPESNSPAPGLARLTGFQHRGYYLAYLSECPIAENEESVKSAIARLGPTLIRRIKFNYRPKHIAPLGQELSPLVDVLRVAGFGPVLLLDQGLPLPTPGTGNREWAELFQRAVSSVAPRDDLSSGYDRIQLTQSEGDLGAGGGT